jgi:predicted ester cyclase
VEGEEAGGDLVRSRLVLSGTDRGSGIMWYPPTGRRVGFEAKLYDRFRVGKLVERTPSSTSRVCVCRVGGG